MNGTLAIISEKAKIINLLYKKIIKTYNKLKKAGKMKIIKFFFLNAYFM